MIRFGCRGSEPAVVLPEVGQDRLARLLVHRLDLVVQRRGSEDATSSIARGVPTSPVQVQGTPGGGRAPEREAGCGAEAGREPQLGDVAVDRPRGETRLGHPVGQSRRVAQRDIQGTSIDVVVDREPGGQFGSAVEASHLLGEGGGGLRDQFHTEPLEVRVGRPSPLHPGIVPPIAPTRAPRTRPAAHARRTASSIADGPAVRPRRRRTGARHG